MAALAVVHYLSRDEALCKTFKSVAHDAEDLQFLMHLDSSTLPFSENPSLNIVMTDLGSFIESPLLSKHSSIIIVDDSIDRPSIVSAFSLGARGFLHNSISAIKLKGSIYQVIRGELALHPKYVHFLAEALQTRSSLKNSDLSLREIEVLNLLADGSTKKQISESLAISYATVDTHVRRIYEKLGVVNAAAAVKVAFQKGVLK